jgi:hypothetical protein
LAVLRSGTICIASVLPSQIKILYLSITVEWIIMEEIQFLGELDLPLANLPLASLRKLFCESSALILELLSS